MSLCLEQFEQETLDLVYQIDQKLLVQGFADSIAFQFIILKKRKDLLAQLRDVMRISAEVREQCQRADFGTPESWQKSCQLVMAELVA